MIAFFSNLYKTDPIKFFMMIAVIYLLLNQTKVVENLKTDQVDLTAISTVSQLAQRMNNALDIDPHGNVTFKQNVTNNGNVKHKKNVIVDGKVGIGTNNPATKLDVKSWWNDLITIRPNNGKSVKFITGTNNFGIMVNNSTKEAMKLFHNDGTIEVDGKGMHLITKHVGDNSQTNLGYNANEWVCIHAGMNLDWNNSSPGRIETFCYVHKGIWHLQSEIEGAGDKGRHRILCIPRKMFTNNKIDEKWMNWG